MQRPGERATVTLAIHRPPEELVPLLTKQGNLMKSMTTGNPNFQIQSFETCRMKGVPVYRLNLTFLLILNSDFRMAWQSILKPYCVPAGVGASGKAHLGRIEVSQSRRLSLNFRICWSRFPNVSEIDGQNGQLFNRSTYKRRSNFGKKHLDSHSIRV